MFFSVYRYRHNARINEARRRKENTATVIAPPSLPSKPYAIIYLNRQFQRQDSPIESIEVEVYDADKYLAKIEPVNFVGRTGDEIKKYAKQCLELVEQAFGITKYAKSVSRVKNNNF